MTRRRKVATRVTRRLRDAAEEAPLPIKALDWWLAELQEGTACPFCGRGPLTRCETLNGRCEKCRRNYLEVAEDGGAKKAGGRPRRRPALPRGRRAARSSTDTTPAAPVRDSGVDG